VAGTQSSQRETILCLVAGVTRHVDATLCHRATGPPGSDSIVQFYDITDAAIAVVRRILAEWSLTPGWGLTPRNS